MSCGVLAESFGPGAIAMAVVNFADETEFAGRADLFFEPAQIGAEFVIIGDAKIAVLEIAAEGEGELFFARLGEIDRLDLPTVLVTVPPLGLLSTAHIRPRPCILMRSVQTIRRSSR